MLKKILLLICIISPMSVVAKVIKINLVSIESKKLTEKRGDEVYFSVLEYPNNTRPNIKRIPEFPEYWVSDKFPLIKDVSLFQTELANNKSVQVILSLVEADFPPLDVDDHLGSAKITLKNINNKLKVDWQKADYIDQPKTTIEQNEVVKYNFKGKNSDYTVTFSIN